MPQLGTRPPWALIVPLLAGLVFAVCWIIALPPFQGPDESSHYAYVQSIADRHVMPWTAVNGAHGGFATSSEQHVAEVDAGLSTLLGNPSAKAPASVVDERFWRAADARLTPAARRDAGVNTASKNPPLSYLYAAVWYELSSRAGVFDRVFWLRIANLPLLLVVLLSTWGLIGLVLPGRRSLQVLGTGAVAVQPVLLQMTAVVNPDLFLAAVWSAGIYVAALLVVSGATRRRAAAMLALAAAAPLTHGRGIALVPVALLALALSAERYAGQRVRIRRAWLAAAAVGSLAVVGGAVAYATSFSVTPSSVREFGAYVWQFYLPKLSFMNAPISGSYSLREAFVDRLFSSFASLEVTFSPSTLIWVERAVELTGVLAIIGVLTRWRAVRREWRLAAVFAAVVVFSLAFMHAAAFRSLLNGTGEVLTGRYLLPLMTLYGLTVAVAVSWLPRRIATAAGAAALTGLTVFQLSALTLLTERFYA